jgi:hypothetical protein
MFIGISFLGPFAYQGWELTGIDIDEEEEDADADNEEEEEGDGEEVDIPIMSTSLLPYNEQIYSIAYLEIMNISFNKFYCHLAISCMYTW